MNVHQALRSLASSDPEIIICGEILNYSTLIILTGIIYFNWNWASQVALAVKKLSASAQDIRNVGSIPGLGRSLGGRNGNPLQYSCLENPMDIEAWQATVHGVAKN